MKTVSIIIPAYNEERTISRVLESVLSQTVKCEVLVIDDGSTDKTRELAMKYPVRLISASRGGPGHARNLGCKLSTGEIIAFIDADELIPPNFIEACLRHFDDKEVVAVMPAEEFQCTDTFWGRCFRVYKLTTAPRIHTTAKLVRKALFEEVGGFDCSLIRFQDQDLILRMKKIAKTHGYEFAVEPSAATCHIEEATSLSEMLKHAVLYGASLPILAKKYRFHDGCSPTVFGSVFSLLFFIVLLGISVWNISLVAYLALATLLLYLTAVTYVAFRTKDFVYAVFTPLLILALIFAYLVGMMKFVVRKGKILK
jgi:glycosyltransferase involved in cell wall biosynthesis